MLSLSVTDLLTIVDPAALKRSPASLPPSITLSNNPIATAWASDNSVLYISSTRTISRYDPSSNQLKALHTSEDDHNSQCLVYKGKSSVIFSTGDKIHVLECGTSPAMITQTLTSHKRTIASLSLSNDSTLLASAAVNSIHVHNLTLGSHTILRGLPPGEVVTACTFHPHTRTRLLVCTEKLLLVYDTTRASGPLKTVPMNEPASGGIISIACSPFSKTLVAVATAAGYIGLIDLDKEKGLFRTLGLDTSLTTIAFSPEGAAIYVGTENGKLLVIDLRALDKSPKAVVVSESGNRIDTLAVQKRMKNIPDDTRTASTPAKIPVAALGPKAAPSPLRPRVNRPTRITTPARKVSKTPIVGTPQQSLTTKDTNPKKVMLTIRDSPRNNKSTKGSNAAKTKVLDIHTSPKSKHVELSPKSLSVSEPTRHASSARIRKSSTTMNSAGPPTTLPGTTFKAPPSSSNGQTRSSSRKASSASLAPSESDPALSSRSTLSSASISSTALRRKHNSRSPVPPVPPLPTGIAFDNRTKPDNQSCTPSPDLPELNVEPITPVPLQKQKKGLAVLGLGTPEVKAWIKAGTNSSNRGDRTLNSPQGKGKARFVGFEDDDNGPGNEPESRVEELESNSSKSQEKERERSLSVQISPSRPITTGPSGQNHRSSQSWEASPLRPRHAAHMPNTPTAGSAHELLRTIVKDVMYDFQRETKAEMMGLHLDLIRMGRGWKQELRILMEEYVGDLNDLREENRRLRKENERLKRGY